MLKDLFFIYSKLFKTCLYILIRYAKIFFVHILLSTILVVITISKSEHYLVKGNRVFETISQRKYWGEKKHEWTI